METQNKTNNNWVVKFILGVVLGFILAAGIFIFINKNSAKNLTKQINDTIAQVEKLQTQIDELILTKETLEKQNSQQVSTIENLNEQINNSNQESDLDLQETIKSLNKKIESLTADKQTLNNTIDSLVYRLKSMPSNNTCTVFYYNDDKLIYTEDVSKGANVKNIPTVPATQGYDVSWSLDGTNINEDKVITVVKSPKTYNVTYHLNYNYKNGFSEHYEGAGFSFKYDGGLHCDCKLTINNYKFTYLNNEYRIDIANSEVYDSLDQCVGQIWNYDNDYYFVVGSMVFYTDSQFNNASTSIDMVHLYDDNLLYSYGNLLVRVDRTNKQIIDVMDNQVLATLDTIHLNDLIYDFDTNTVTDSYDPSYSEQLINNKFVYKDVTYVVDFANLFYFELSDGCTEYIDNAYAKVNTTYKYGEDVDISFLPNSIKLVKPTSFQSMDIEELISVDNYSSQFYKPAGYFFYCENYLTCYTADYRYLIKKPIGDIDVYVLFNKPAV